MALPISIPGNEVYRRDCSIETMASAARTAGFAIVAAAKRIVVDLIFKGRRLAQMV